MEERNGKVIEYSKGTTPLWELPEYIYYRRVPAVDKIAAIGAGGYGSNFIASFSINKYGLKTAYEMAVKKVYGDKYKSVLEKYPVPTIAEEDLLVKKKDRATGVYGITLFFGNTNKPERNSYLTSFGTHNPSIRKPVYFSILKYGLEEAWRRAVEFRYTHYDPLPNDDASFKPEWWDLINPKYKYKTR